MDINWGVVFSASSAFATALLLYILNRRDRRVEKEKEDKKRWICSIEQSIRDEIGELDNEYNSLENRVRTMENMHISEEKVKALLKERVKPLEDGIYKLERDMKDSYSDLSNEIKQNNVTLLSHIQDISSSLQFLKGKFEARRSDDV